MPDESKKFLTPREVSRLLAAAKKNEHGARDFCLMLTCFRHAYRVSELIDVRLSDVDLETGHIHVRRKKGSRSTHQPIEGDEQRALRAYLRERSTHPQAGTDYLFLSERGPLTRQAVNYLVTRAAGRAKLGRVTPHTLRHACGYYLANEGVDTRLIQDYLGHRNINHTVIYTQTAPARFKGLFSKVSGFS